MVACGPSQDDLDLGEQDAQRIGLLDIVVAADVKRDQETKMPKSKLISERRMKKTGRKRSLGLI